MAEYDNGDITVKIPSDFVDAVIGALRAESTNRMLDKPTFTNQSQGLYLIELANDIAMTSRSSE